MRWFFEEFKMSLILFLIAIAAWCIPGVAFATALTANRDTPVKLRGTYVVLTVKDEEVIYAGSMVSVDSNGEAVSATDSAGDKVIGRAEEYVDNADDGETVKVRIGIFLWEDGGSATDADIGDVCYVEDDQTVNTSAAGLDNDIIAGIVYEVDDDGLWIDTGHLAKTAGSFTTLAVSGAATFSSTISAGGHLTLANTKDLLCATDAGSDIGATATEFGNIFIDGFVYTDGLTNQSAANIDLGASLVPGVDNARDLGATATEMRNIFVDGLAYLDGITNQSAAAVPMWVDLEPGSDNAFDLGATATEWKDIFVDGLAYIDTLTNQGGAAVLVGVDIVPDSDDARDLGSSSAQYKDAYIDGKLYVDAIEGAYANKTANYTNAATDFVMSYNTSAVTTNTLPEASTVLGDIFVIALQDDDGDLVVATDGTDTFDGTNNKITFEDAGDSCWLMATAANVYTILVNVGGTLGTQ